MKMSIFVETKISYTKHLEIVTGKKLQVLKLTGAKPFVANHHKNIVLNENNKNSF